MYAFIISHCINKCCSRSDIPNRTLNVRLSDAEIEERLKIAKVPARKLTPLLVSYREKFKGVNCYGDSLSGR